MQCSSGQETLQEVTCFIARDTRKLYFTFTVVGRDRGLAGGESSQNLPPPLLFFIAVAVL